MNKLESLEYFVENCNDIATLTNLDTGKIIAWNPIAKEYLGNCKSLGELIEAVSDPITEANITFCKYVQDICLLEERDTVSYEHFNGSYYVAVRSIFQTESMKVLLTIINKTNSDEIGNKIFF